MLFLWAQAEFVKYFAWHVFTGCFSVSSERLCWQRWALQFGRTGEPWVSSLLKRYNICEVQEAIVTFCCSCSNYALITFRFAPLITMHKFTCIEVETVEIHLISLSFLNLFCLRRVVDLLVWS